MRRLLLLLVPLVLVATPVSAQDGHAGHAGHTVPQPALADPHAGHVMPAQPVDPHAGHQMPMPETTDPHAGHAMPAQPDPHAGHTMPTQPDPHAGHQVPMPEPADPHAGHVMPTEPAGAVAADGRRIQASPPAAAFSGPAHAADAVFGAEAMAASRQALASETGAMRTTSVWLDRLEAGVGDDDTTWLWDAQGWIGGDIHRFVWKTEGQADDHEGLGEVEVQALYSRAVRPFWDVQIGLRQDVVRDGEDTTHLVAGLQGVAPGWWEIDAAAFLSQHGDLTARIEAEQDLRLTQRWILQPRVELDLSATDAPTRGLSPGLTGLEAGLRLRYEIQREFAPYVGVEWHSTFGTAADQARTLGHPTEDTRLLIGIRAWF